MKNIRSFFCAYDILAACYVLLAMVFSAVFGFKIDFLIIFNFQYDAVFGGTAALYLVIYAAILALQTRKNGEDMHLFGEQWRKKLKVRFFSWHKIINLVKVLFLLKITLLIYCNIKQAIPFINPRLFDPQLLFIDKVVHLGINPNKLTVSLLGNAFFSRSIDLIYISWYLLKPLVLVYFSVIPEQRLHIRFFTSYFAMWISGGLFAVLIPSLGPIYTDSQWFAGVHMPFARGLQQMLWNHYEAASASPGKYKVFIYEGIAAFPSLHVGIVALFAVFIWQISRKAGMAMWIYVAFIQVGSVLLGWHYAIDGYFTIGLAFVLYWLSGKAVKPSPDAHLICRSSTCF